MDGDDVFALLESAEVLADVGVAVLAAAETVERVNLLSVDVDLTVRHRVLDLEPEALRHLVDRKRTPIQIDGPSSVPLFDELDIRPFPEEALRHPRPAAVVEAGLLPAFARRFQV
ncbi:MAG: hypothetical protein R2748_33310 [Bryobacterales bacterium]